MLPAPSDIVFSGKSFPNAPPSFVIRVVLAVRQFLVNLTNRLVPAEIVVFEASIGIGVTALLGAIVRAKIPELVEERGPLSAKDIADALDLDADAVHRTLRALAIKGIFTMSAEGVFSSNSRSRALAGGTLSRTREWVLYFSSKSNVDSWLAFGHTLKTGQNAFALVHEMNVWEWFDRHEDEREMFAHAMMGLTVADAPFIAAMVPFGETKKLCDVAGGRGTLLSELLLRHPHLKGVLCEGAGVAESAKKLFAARGVENRVEVVTGSFFERVPSGCDAYLMKNILHDWDDETSKKILRVVRAAMKPGHRILLCELLVDKNSRDPIGTFVDLQMMIACEQGRERSLDEFRALLEATGFRYMRVYETPTICVVEGEAK